MFRSLRSLSTRARNLASSSSPTSGFSGALFLKLGIGMLVLAAAGCAAQPHVDDESEPSGPAVTSNEALVHGAVDHGRHPAVVALIATDDEGTALCTGTLIAPDVVLTARHCVSTLRSESVDCPAHSAQLGPNRVPSSISVILGDDAMSGRAVARGKAIFTPDTDVLCDADIALVRLDRAVPGITPLSLAPAGAAMKNGKILAVGYGKLGDDGDAGVRRFRTDVPIVSVSNTEFMVGESTCSGDSGGPAFDETTGGILGVVSRGGAACDGRGARNIYTRIDPFLDLIGRAIGHPPEVAGGSSSGSGSSGSSVSTGSSGSSDMGDTCSSGSSCAGGVCAQNQYCSRHCGGDAGRCPAGFRCAHDASTTSGTCAKKT